MVKLLTCPGVLLHADDCWSKLTRNSEVLLGIFTNLILKVFFFLVLTEGSSYLEMIMIFSFMKNVLLYSMQ